ncbi:DNA polymerase IV [Jiangella ureilytica]|uniref:DNA polymerase IV n=1 Tax=Jiangella ureilytica TaxID=2530374 RepID=UPI00193E40B7|nr:DNA polymerase IV [Jiangella ureilytica]
MSRWVLHVDLDQFIAAVEVLRRPELRGKPVVVGGDGDPTKRGVVATASYEARAFGVHSGLPMRTALKRCPDAIFLPSDKEAYEAVSVDVMATLREFGTVEVLGWDEAFVDAGDDDPEGTARRIQRRVREATELECTVGIGENKLQAKLATGFGKPAGVATLTYATWFDVLGDRPTDALWGIGSKTAKKLAEMNIHTVHDLAATHPDTVAARFGPTIGPWLVRIARGVASARVTGEAWMARSRGKEKTFQQNLDDWAEVQAQVVALAHDVTREVVAEERPAVRVVVKVRYAPFFTSTHGHKLPEPTSDADAIAAAALVALDQFTDRRPVRLLGVRAEFGG